MSKNEDIKESGHFETNGCVYPYPSMVGRQSIAKSWHFYTVYNTILEDRITSCG